MTANIIFTVVGIGIILGLGVVIWSYIDTRKKYYDNYIGRRAK